jgi:hypothetical protein
MSAVRPFDEAAAWQLGHHLVIALLSRRVRVTHMSDHLAPEAPTMTAQPLPALTSGDPSAWDQALYAFLVEKGNRSGARRTVESYSGML